MPHDASDVRDERPARGLNALIEWVLAHSRWTLIAVLVATAAALVLALRVELVTSRTAMAPKDDADQRRLMDLEARFGGGDPLIVVLSGLDDHSGSASERRRLADRMASALIANEHVRSVLHRVPAAWLERHGLWLGSTADRFAVAERFEALLLPGSSERRFDGWLSLNERIAERLHAPSPRESDLGARFLDMLRFEARFFADLEGFFADLEREDLSRLFGADPDAGAESYLATRDGTILYLLVAPRDGDDSLPAQRRFVTSVRATCATVLEGYPNHRVGLTGEPALNVDEMDAVESDSTSTSVLAGLGVTLLAVFAFRHQRYALVALAALGVAVVWAFGAVELILGHLNLITSSFVSILVGVGIDFFIHPVSELELAGAHTIDGERALRRAFRRTLGATLVSGTTTAGAFFCLSLMDYEGFAEMGVVSGVGVLLCLVSMLTAFPALLALVVRHAKARSVPRAEQPSGLARLGRQLELRPFVPLTLGVVLTAVAALRIDRVRFDTDILGLLPRGSSAVTDLLVMAERSDLSPRISYVTAPTLDGLRVLEAAAKRQPEIRRFESALDLLPRDPSAVARELDSVRQRLEALRLVDAPAALDRASLAQSLDSVAAAAESAGGIDPSLRERLADAARQARDAVARARYGIDPYWRRARDEVLVGLRQALVGALESVTSGPPSPENLPEALRERLVTNDGVFLAYLHPDADLKDPAALSAFNRAAAKVHADAVGWPQLFEKITRRISEGFRVAFAVGLALVLLITFVSSRSLVATLLALVPLGLGVVWMLGAMGWLGLDFNLANLVALPLILGVGIDNGVHLVHRRRAYPEEGVRGAVAATGRGILVASATTMIGFGSLGLASHRGMASLGIVLLLGVGCCLVAALFVLPPLMSVSEGRRRGAA